MHTILLHDLSKCYDYVNIIKIHTIQSEAICYMIYFTSEIGKVQVDVDVTMCHFHFA